MTVIVEADGASRGNPGPASYGAVLRSADGTVIAEASEVIGEASNNVAEYHGLIAGLELANEHAPGEDVEVRMDSKLVVEQMSGRWKIKHPAMRELALRARDIAPSRVRYQWIPRDQNSHADRLANEALDGKPSRRSEPSVADDPAPAPTSTEAAATAPDVRPPRRGWAPSADGTNLLLIRHGSTEHTEQKLFSGSRVDLPLSDLGRQQVESLRDRMADWKVDVWLSSPVRRAHETAMILSEEVGIAEELAEVDFGSWDGLTFAQIAKRYPGELTEWLSDPSVPAPDGESLASVHRRVGILRERLLKEYEGATIALVSHVTPIKSLIADALEADLSMAFRFELGPASLSEVAHYPDGRAVLRRFNLS